MSSAAVDAVMRSKDSEGLSIGRCVKMSGGTVNFSTSASRVGGIKFPVDCPKEVTMKTILVWHDLEM